MKKNTFIAGMIAILYIVFSCEKPSSSISQESTSENLETEMPYVDLGLSVKWASKNIGAKSYLEPGNFYAWGETEVKMKYYADSYLFYEDGKFTSYINITNELVGNPPNYEWVEVGDGLVTLCPADDVATTLLGKDWRIPTPDEWNELLMKCKLTTSHHRIDGKIRWLHTLTAENGNSISFIDNGHYYDKGFWAAGTFASLWTSSRCDGAHQMAIIMSFNNRSWGQEYVMRYEGYPVRAVYVGDKDKK